MTVTRISIGERQTEIRTAGAVQWLAIGSETTAGAFFHHDPPTPYEIERAIEAVEVEVMRARPSGPVDPVLIAGGAALRELADAAGGTNMLTLDVVEQMFQRVASESLGDPMARRGLPAGNALAGC